MSASFDHFKLHLSRIRCAALSLPDNVAREQIPALLGQMARIMFMPF
jgi:hypothetical protein